MDFSGAFVLAVVFLAGFLAGKYVSDLEHRAAPTRESTTVYGHNLPGVSPDKHND